MNTEHDKALGASNTMPNNEASLIHPRRDAEGRLLAGAAPDAQVLGDFFETDVRENPLVCDEIAEALDAVETDSGARRELTGNLYSLNLSAAGAQLVNEYDQDAPGYALSLTQLRRALARWRRHFHAVPP